MSNTIPPLLCSTPPPIDFDDGNEHDDDFGAFESADTEFGQFDGPSLPATPKHSDNKHKEPIDLLVPDFSSFQTKSNTNQVQVARTNEVRKQNTLELEVTIEDCTEPEIQLQLTNHIVNSELSIDPALNDRIEYVIDEPPPIEDGYSPGSQSTKNSRGESPQSLEFNPEILSDDDSIGEFQVNEIKYDDNTSLPSLKFDAIDIVKSETPIMEDKTILNKSLVSEELMIAEKFSITSAFEAEKIVEQENVAHEYVYRSPERNLTEEGDTQEENFESNGKQITKIETICTIKSSDRDLQIEDRHSSREEISKSDSSEMISENSLPIDNLNCIGEEISKSESPPELEVDEDFNTDFQEFEVFSGTQNSKDDPPFTIENNTNATDDPGEIIFKADFSQITSAIEESVIISSNIIENLEIEKSINQSKPTEISEKFVVDNSDGFQDFVENSEPDNDNKDNVEDDDFGEFNDFQETCSSYQAPITIAPITTAPIKMDDKLKSVLEMMFPNEEDRASTDQDESKYSVKVLNNNLTSNLREIDTAKALEYQWTSSSMKHSLIKALGIDSRNILYGEKWNSSRPRFAANLGFNPLEPLKPMKLSSSSMSTSDTATYSDTFPSRSTGSEVPAVKFDWNSSGLVNPLDGVKEILHERKTEKIYPTKFNEPDESSEPKSSDKSSISNVESPKFITPLSDINNDLKDTNQIVEATVTNNIENYVNSVEHEGNHIRSSSSSNTFVVPLKETHIYTPSKSENSVSRSIKAGESCSIDFDYQMAAAGIVINEKVVKKEYRDIVYNPEAQIISPSQLETIVGPDSDNVAVVDPNKSFRHKSTSEIFNESISAQTLNIIEKVPSTSQTIEEFTDDFSDFQQNNPTVQQFTSSLPIADFPLADKYSSIQNTEIVKKCDKKPIKETLKNESSFDDEFSDFQSVPAPVILSKPLKDLNTKSRTETPTVSDEMILSPAILLPQAIKFENTEPQINWPGDPGINPDELARLEQLFPQVKGMQSSSSMNNSSKSNATTTSKDDDDWSDFVSVPANVNRTTNQLLQSPSATTKLSTISKTYDDDDWSEFVSSTPASSTIITNKSAWPKAPMPPPHFNSWNQPNFYSTLPIASQQHGIYLTSHQFQQANNTTATGGPAHQTNNNQFLMNGYLNPVGNHLELSHLKVSQQQQQQQQQMQYQEQQQRRNQNVLRSQLNLSPSISLIPDLGFVAPKSIINVPRTNFSKK